ncbi:lamin tail domain-containing protein [Halobaculum sp. CBA1158]|uniref:lamin tail domain-containing protein n=1 Tax=Halobaculum sp. CBA1158 TaxID=2904243 RepID=UPI001F2BE245|nr:lamin tail domain-containing protein [Halobaculum sp. CBA1158]UIO98793.1 lamin tail domain-containing protein [Halobaculum sp. CBA1158]
MKRSGLATVAVCLLLALSGCVVGPVGSDPAGDATGGGPGDPTATAPPGSDATHATASIPADGTEVTVVEVVDGDTVRIEYDNGTTDTARLLGVDTPEVYGENSPEEFEGVPDTEAGRACLDEYADRASAYAKNRLLGERVTIGFDANEPRRGYYDRLLVYVHHDGGSFNYALVDRGLARVYDSSFERGETFYAAEERAMSDGRGLWSCRDGTPRPAADDETTATASATATPEGDGVVVSRIHADAEGDDAENLNDEYVVLTNRGDESVDLSGWTLEDAAGFTYEFPEGTTIDAGASLTVHVGQGADTETDLYWGRERPTLNNDGETVTIRDASGAVVAERST